MSLTHRYVGWSAVYDFGISWSYSLTFLNTLNHYGTQCRFSLIIYFALDQYKLVLITYAQNKKNAKIRNRYNQVLHLTWDTTWESDKNT